jgi:hypothetical protein
MQTPATTLDRLRTHLETEAASDGGWPYYAGKRPRIEPTCWALLATRTAMDARDLQRHLSFLAARQGGDGLLLDAPGQPPNISANALAAIVLQSDGVRGSGPDLQRLLAALDRVEGATAPRDGSTQDNSLKAWPWIPGTFSWVEPTALALIALKRADARRFSRHIAVGDAMLINRVCGDGGWNYGNASAFGQDLRPYVPTTALALLALRNRPGEPAVQRSLAALDRLRASERSPIALALALLCLRLYARPSADVAASLAEAVPSAERRGHVHALALAACALLDRESDLEALGA